MSTRPPGRAMPQSDRERKWRRKVRARAWLKEYLRANPCVDCGEADIRVLEFDHRNPADKVANVGRLAADGFGVKSLIREVLKCEVRCANCHRIRTTEEHHFKFRRSPSVTACDGSD